MSGAKERNADSTSTDDLPSSTAEGLEGVNLGGSGELLKRDDDTVRGFTSASSQETASIVKAKLEKRQARRRNDAMRGGMTVQSIKNSSFLLITIN